MNLRKEVVNGCAYYEDGSDTNVGSIEKKNIEDKEIEDLNDFADLLRPEQRYYTNIIKKVIEDRLKDRKKIKELEEKNKLILNSKIGVDLSYNDYIPKQKIKDQIDELNQKYEDSKNEKGESPYFYPALTIRILEKLLKEDENKNINLKEAIKNLKEIVELAEEEINNNDVNVTAILDLKDLKSLQVVINKLESEE